MAVLYLTRPSDTVISRGQAYCRSFAILREEGGTVVHVAVATTMDADHLDDSDGSVGMSASHAPADVIGKHR
ncbi:hypothetical protein Manayef4_12020 [Frankia sp. CgMI4]|nr:hypothetical protein Manayef4_12020 [Frankia sp. CgIM4]